MDRMGTPRQLFQPFLVFTLILLVLSAGLNFVTYSHATTISNQLKKEQSNYLKLSRALKQLDSQHDELQNRYDQLLKKNKQLEDRLNSHHISRGEYGLRAYLTIDDGPDANTEQVLQILDRYEVPATFFVIGHNNAGDGQIYKRILDRGHTLGNHTMTHNLKTIYRSKDAFMEDLLRMEDLLAEKAGVRPDIIRFPGGSSNTGVSTPVLREIIIALEEKGYDYFDWNVSAGDCNPDLTLAQLVGNITTQADQLPGQDLVILMHSFNRVTVKALPQIIQELRERGYTFAALRKGVVNVKHR